ncbi:MAG TPA: hypothetical protein VHQ98_10330 [Gaiellaceae bacterium]|nr:hypothetical protein [Gaiellaceae bacterium]
MITSSGRRARACACEPAASLADLPKGVKGFKAGTRSARVALVGVVTDQASAKHAADALRAADEKAGQLRPPGHSPHDLTFERPRVGPLVVFSGDFGRSASRARARG